MTNDICINGKWQSGSGATFQNICPATGDVISEISSATNEQVAQAVSAAHKAFESWSLTSLDERISILKKYAEILESKRDLIAETISRDMGKALWESLAEVSAMVGKIDISIKALKERAGDWTQETPFGSQALTHRPHGVMAVFGPYNFPGHLPNGHIVPALLAGNTCVFKPSELAPTVAVLMMDACVEAGLPEGCLNLVQGGRDTGQALLNADVNGVLFTGSQTTGTAFHKHFAGRPDVILALEMGGNNPLIVHKIEDLETTVETIFQSAFITTGQRCTCARRLILTETVDSNSVIAALKARIDAVQIGKWNEEGVYLGPLVSARAAQAAFDFETDFIKRGGQPIHALSGAVEDTGFVRPGIIDMTAVNDVPDEELFGPFLQVYRTSDLETAIKLANKTRFGLSAGVITDDFATWEHARARLRAGILNKSRPTTGASSAMPFGGPGLSGNARPSAYYAADYCAWPQAMQIG